MKATLQKISGCLVREDERWPVLDRQRPYRFSYAYFKFHTMEYVGVVIHDVFIVLVPFVHRFKL